MKRGEMLVVFFYRVKIIGRVWKLGGDKILFYWLYLFGVELLY